MKVSVWVLLSAAAASAQPGRAVSESVADFRSVRDLIVRAAEKMPEAEYGFRLAPEVRTFAQQVAHIADDQYNLCAPVKGETRKDAYTAVEKSLKTKSELVPELKRAFAYCDAAYDGIGAPFEVVQFGATKRTKFSMLNWNVWHTWEHYGNIVVYLRVKGIVPPSSEKR
jgi:uncharacterized damage-inducible protein DinB